MSAKDQFILLVQTYLILHGTRPSSGFSANPMLAVFILEHAASIPDQDIDAAHKTQPLSKMVLDYLAWHLGQMPPKISAPLPGPRPSWIVFTTPLDSMP